MEQQSQDGGLSSKLCERVLVAHLDHARSIAEEACKLIAGLAESLPPASAAELLSVLQFEDRLRQALTPLIAFARGLDASGDQQVMERCFEAIEAATTSEAQRSVHARALGRSVDGSAAGSGPIIDLF